MTRFLHVADAVVVAVQIEVVRSVIAVAIDQARVGALLHGIWKGVAIAVQIEIIAMTVLVAVDRAFDLVCNPVAIAVEVAPVADVRDDCDLQVDEQPCSP